MIKTFNCRDTETLFETGKTKKFAPIAKVAKRKLLLLDAATIVKDLRIPPGNRLKTLLGDRAGQYSIRINNQFRICFSWEGSDANDVEIVDYH